MALSHEIKYETLDNLYLDPTNPRLGKANAGPSVKQERVRELVRSWAPEELAVSFLESGFWPQEAIVVVKEPLYGKPDKLVVVEGNRRIVALQYLRDAFCGKPVSPKWGQLIKGRKAPADLFTKIPYIMADSRNDVKAFLGFRHVTGIKEWDPAQKAEYIAHLVDDLGMPYDEISRKTGNWTETVRRNYITYRVFRQAEMLSDRISIELVEQKFSVLFLALRESAVQRFLNVNITAEPKNAKTPVPKNRLDNLVDFAAWLFGTKDRKPLFTDSRYVGDFARILANPDAVKYLRSSLEPSLDLALQKAGVEEEDVINRIKTATDDVEIALGRVHLHLKSADVQKAVSRFAQSAIELIKKFPDIAKVSLEDGGERKDA